MIFFPHRGATAGDPRAKTGESYEVNGPKSLRAIVIPGPVGFPSSSTKGIQEIRQVLCFYWGGCAETRAKPLRAGDQNSRRGTNGKEWVRRSYLLSISEFDVQIKALRKTGHIVADGFSNLFVGGVRPAPWVSQWEQPRRFPNCPGHSRGPGVSRV